MTRSSHFCSDISVKVKRVKLVCAEENHTGITKWLRISLTIHRVFISLRLFGATTLKKKMKPLPLHAFRDFG